MSDTESNSGRARMPLLRSGNYFEWAMRMEALLTRKELWEVVAPPKEAVGTPVPVKPEGGAEASSTTATSAETKRSEKKMAYARSLMIDYADMTQLAYMHSEDPREIWILLRKVHRSVGLATVMSLKRKFINGQKKPDQSMENWIGKIKALQWELGQLGNTIDDKDVIIALTNGLGSEYDTFVQTLDSTPGDELTLDFVIKRLINEESWRGDRPTESGSGDIALASSAKGLCWVCGKAGHQKAGCPDYKARKKEGEDKPKKTPEESAHFAIAI